MLGRVLASDPIQVLKFLVALMLLGTLAAGVIAFWT